MDTVLAFGNKKKARTGRWGDMDGSLVVLNPRGLKAQMDHLHI